MHYEETLQYMFEHLPMYQRIGAAAYKKDLTNTLKLCSLLNNPQEKFTSVHVAGTNGKGSVSNLIASVLYEAGYKTGLYTSPHLIDFRERIRVNGKMCNKNFVIQFIEKIKPHIEEIQPSFFEITVAMAFDYFVREDVDVAVVEVGLGGRLDSTNIIHPALSVITNISYDHQNMLGDTLEKIAFEKAGIIKKEIPVVIGEYQPATFPVFTEKANQLYAPLYLAEENISVDVMEISIDKMVLNASCLNQLVYPALEVGLTGNYQIKNVKTVLQSIEILKQREIEIPEDAVYDGFKNIIKNTGFSGRLQTIGTHPLTICDCAHNAAGLHELFLYIQTFSFNRLHIVTGMVNDKDPHKNLKEFPREAVYYFCKPDIPRGLQAEDLKILGAQYHLFGNSYKNVKEALYAAHNTAKNDDLILICGSIFVVGEALSATL